MGIEYYLVDHAKKTVFELGKGNWPGLLAVRGDIHTLADFCWEALFKYYSGDSAGPETSERMYYCFWLAEKLVDFAGDTAFEELSLEHDAGDFIIDHVGNPAMGETGKGKGYEIVGNRYIEDEEIEKHIPRITKKYMQTRSIYLRTLDVKQTHMYNPDCPSRIIKSPRGTWYCVDCGVEILEKTVKTEYKGND